MLLQKGVCSTYSSKIIVDRLQNILHYHYFLKLLEGRALFSETPIYRTITPFFRVLRQKYNLQNKITVVGVVLLLIVLGIFASVWNGGITSLVVFEEQTLFVDSVFNETTTFVLNISSTNSLKASGIVSHGVNGSARLYYQDSNNSLSLIYESLVGEGMTSFENACVDTCELSMSNVTLLVVLRGENVSLVLSNITYSSVLPTGVIETVLIPDINLSNSTTLNLSQYFIETANHPLIFNATVPEQVRAVVSEDLLFLSERETGVFNATVIASNGVVNASNSFLIFVGNITVNDTIRNQTVINESVNQTNATINQTINDTIKKFIEDNVDDKVEEEFLKNDTVPVIVFLKVPLQSFGISDSKSILKRKKVEIDIVKDAVLNFVLSQTPVPLNQITGAQVVDVVVPALAVKKEYDVINAFSAEIKQSALNALRADKNVVSVVFDRAMNISLQDSIPLIRANDTHELLTSLNETITGHGQSVCVLDTGIDVNHPALAGKVIGGIDFVNNDADAMDDNNHGTHVSGIVSAAAPSSKIVPVKVCDASGSCTASNILSGIDYCMNNSVDFNVSVISGSLGDGGNYNETNCPSWFDSAFSTANELGIVSVFASGNNGYLNGINYPACSPFTISVGATDKTDNIASFSNRGSLLDVFAPGVGINSTIVGGYGTLSGTSMSTPFVSGGVALMKQVRENVTLDEVRTTLQTAGVNVSNWKRVDVLSVVQSLLVSIKQQGVVLVNNFYHGNNWTVVFNVSGTNNLVVVPSDGSLFMEVPDNNLTLNGAKFISFVSGLSTINVTLADDMNRTLPYDIYLIKRRIEQIKKRLGELE